ncbi:hypothetical protein HHI36_006132 [Cryptolaemus montrouzieri]|uniref:RNase H type-1 domain-containing protein n=1 Tax=Cryptolaemus montrouzieri TaxID=559131 RepID=A0ABD2NWC5_9CUCU
MCAEAYAIQSALKLVEERDFYSTLICSDSLTCLKAISTGNSNTSLINVIRDQLFSTQNEITFLYTPAHCGIQGNEDVDTAAKEASKSNFLRSQVLTKIDYETHKLNWIFLGIENGRP